MTIDNGQKKADAKKLISLMMLAVKKGQTVKFIIEGADEDKAAAVLEAFMKENL